MYNCIYYIWQGVGYVALEDHFYGPDGHLVNNGARKYHIPTVSSIPLQMNVTLLKDSDNVHAIYSSKAGSFWIWSDIIILLYFKLGLMQIIYNTITFISKWFLV